MKITNMKFRALSLSLPPMGYVVGGCDGGGATLLFCNGGI